jgi:chitinase
MLILVVGLTSVASCGGSRDRDRGGDPGDLGDGSGSDRPDGGSSNDAGDDEGGDDGGRDLGTTPTRPKPRPKGLAAVLSRSTFEKLFPDRNRFYSYDGLIEAARRYGAFATSGNEAARKREVAAFLANVAHETGFLHYVEEIHKDDYCAPQPGCPCAPGKRYYGRGPIQISWNYNYCAFGEALGYGHELQAHPERVAEDATIAWQTGLWFWMTSTGASRQTCHDAIGDGSFGETIRTINGSLECDRGGSDGVRSRVDNYRRFCELLGVPPGDDLGC